MPNIPTHADEIATSSAGVTVQDALDATSGGGSGFDPAVPLDYLTMQDADGTLWTMQVDTDGTWIGTRTLGLATESGDLLVLESGGLIALDWVAIAAEDGALVTTEGGDVLVTE